MPPSVERKLAAILSADVVGYSRLMAEDEDETVRRLAAYRTEITNLVGEHRGRVVDFTGDNFLAEFPTATDAVEAATEIQRVLKARNAAAPAGRAMEFRIGVHLGEVRVEGERLYGDGVNIAARLEGLAEPGGTCISDDVLHQVQRKLELDFDDLGEQTVKNIPDPVHAYRLREREAEAPARRARGARRTVVVSAVSALAAIALALVAYFTIADRTPSPAGPPLTSIAVLPFDDMSADKDQEYFAHGISEELTHVLSQSPRLRVVGRTSAEVVKRRSLSIAEIGEELNVGAVVEGSVRKSGTRLRVAVQLISVADGFHIWSRSYERPVGDVFDIQDEIAAAVARALGGEGGSRRKRPTDNIEAYEKYLVANSLYGQATTESLRKAATYYRQAVEMDPEFVDAYLQLADVTANLWSLRLDNDPSILEDGMAAVDQALAVNDLSARAHTVRARLLATQYDWAGAQRAYERAFELNPRRAESDFIHGAFLVTLGRVDEGLAIMERSVRRDPLGFSLNLTGLAAAQLWIRDDAARAAELLERAIDLAPGSQLQRSLLAFAYHELGRDELALELFVPAFPPEVQESLRAAYQTEGWVGFLGKVHSLAAAQLEDECLANETEGGVLSVMVGEHDRALRCLERGYRRHSLSTATWLKVSSVWDPLRADPRFQDLLRRIGFPES